MSHYMKILLQDALNPSRCQWDDGRKQYLFGSPAQYFTRVRVLGVVRASSTKAIEVDDGTAVTAVQLPTQMRFQSGDLVECIGELRPSRQALRSCYILASNIMVVKDPNMETLRFLEVIKLYKECYFSGRPPPPASELMRPLAPLPTAVMAGIKRKFATESLEYLFDAQKHPKRANGDEFFFTVPATECPRFASGQRKLELRLNKPPFSIISQGDTIILNGSHSVIVGAVRNYATLSIALQAESLEFLLPLGVSAPQAAALPYYRTYFNDQDVSAFGVVVFDVGGISVTSSAPLDAPVQELLEGANLTMDQLTTRLPSLTALEITDALDQLQLDGAIYRLPTGEYSLL
ncbi:unnamed protein product [Aphanomyces euteiches]